MDADVITPTDTFVKDANVKDENVYDYASKNRIAFWEGCAETLHWEKRWNSVMDWNPPFVSWFDGGRLNACYNCLDRYLNTPIENKVAYFWEGEDGKKVRVTYKELHSLVCKLANVLKSKGVCKGDTVAIYMPHTIEAIASMLACARIGAVHTVIFAGFSAEALKGRILDANAKILITADGGVRKGKVIPLKSTSDEAIKDLTCIESVLVLKRTESSVNMVSERDTWLHEELEKVSDECPVEIMEAEDTLFILYTSGTTGKPKGIVHTTGGYLVGAKISTKIVFDIKPDDVFWCTADIGWITGHTYAVYGPLTNGMTQVIYEGAPDQPNKSRFWSLIEVYKVTTFYTAPTAIRLFMKWGEQYLERHDLSSLRLLGSVGEPLNPEAWFWFYKYVGGGKCPIVDTWWQTETGSIMLSTIPGLNSMKPGSVTKPLPGIEARVLDDYGNERDKGYVAIVSPWPSMLRGIHGDTRRFIQTYWNKWGGRYYFPGDAASIDEDGYFWVLGRVDDTINVSAHRIGTMEVESALIEHEAVAEAAVVGIPDELTGQAIIAFVVLREGHEVKENLESEIKSVVVKKIGGIARPKRLFFMKDLPKTRSGKIMRRILRDMALGKTIGDVSTLENASLLKVLQDSLGR